MSNELYEQTKVKITNNIKMLRAIRDPTPEQKDTLNELTRHIEFDDFKKKVHYKGRNAATPQCFIPPDLLVTSDFVKKNLM